MKQMRGVMSLGLVLITLLLAGCGGGSGSTATVVTPGKQAIAAAIGTSVPAATCPTGGIAVNTGIDSNSNGTLDASEIRNTQYVCNGTSAANALMSVTDEPAGANCTAGGKKISVGLDTDNSGALDVAEVTSSNYICNGASGANGLNTLVSTSGEAPGANCVYGGIKVNSGLDTNSNGTLDANEVTSTGYACNVSAGSGGFAWVDVTASSVQAASNMGYMANSASAVAVTLPLAPAVGDVVKVTGVGTGGWSVVPNAGQTIAGIFEVLDPTNWVMSSKRSTTIYPIFGKKNNTIELLYVGGNTFNVLSQVAPLVAPAFSGNYVTQGGLTWMPISFVANWTDANAFCTNNAINGQTGWRMPTSAELSALYTSAAMTGQGWTLDGTWSSTQYSANYHYIVDFYNDGVGWNFVTDVFYVSCVH